MSDELLQALEQVKHPESGKSLPTSGIILNSAVTNERISLKLGIPHMNFHYKDQLYTQCVNAIQPIAGNKDIDIHFAVVAQAHGNSASSKKNDILPNVKNIIAIASGKGGVGKSTVATNLALGLQQLGYKTGLVDADIYGPSIPTMLNLHHEKPKVITEQGQPKMIPVSAYGMPVMSVGFMVEPEQAVIMRGPRLAGMLKQFLLSTIWPELDYLIIDLPPGTGDIQLTLVQTVPVTGAIIVTTPQNVAVVDATKALNMFQIEQINVPVIGVIENMSWFTPAELPNHRYEIFGAGGGMKLAHYGKVDLIGQIPLVMGACQQADQGKPVVLDASSALQAIYLNIASKVHALTEERNAKYAPTHVVQMNT